MVQPFRAEQALEAEGETLRLAIDFEALDAIETLLGGRRFSDVLSEIARPDAPEALTAKVVWGLLRKHHPELGLDHALRLVMGSPGPVGMAVGQLLEAAFPAREEGAAPATEDPPKPRGASKPS